MANGNGDALNQELIDLEGALNRMHEQQNPCTPENHKALVRHAVLTSRAVRDLRRAVDGVPDAVMARLGGGALTVKKFGFGAAAGVATPPTAALVLVIVLRAVGVL